jgi:hypothetical protein
MLTYIVSWSGGDCMLIRCHDEDDLIDRLDQFDDPSEAIWEEYHGAFTITLRPVIERSEDVPPFITYAAELDGEEAMEVADAVSAFAFPATFRAQQEAWEDTADAGLELLLEAEIESKGFSEQSTERLDAWVRRMYADQLDALPPSEREERIQVLMALMGWRRPPGSETTDSDGDGV